MCHLDDLRIPYVLEIELNICKLNKKGRLFLGQNQYFIIL